MSTTAPNDEELTPAGLRRNRLTLAYREGQKAGQDFQRIVQDPDPALHSAKWAEALQKHEKVPAAYRGEDASAWVAGFTNGRHAERGSGELAPSPYEPERKPVR